MFVFAFIAATAVLAFATPISYVAHGYVGYLGSQPSEYKLLQGYVIIDDDIITVDDSEAPDHVFYKYHILDFELFTELDHWQGEGFLHYETSGPKAVSMDNIHPFNDESFFSFKDENGLSYDPGDILSWLTLAPQISIYMGDLLSLGGSSPKFTDFTLYEVLPVPEPSTLFLLGMSLCLFIGVRNREIFK